MPRTATSVPHLLHRWHLCRLQCCSVILCLSSTCSHALSPSLPAHCSITVRALLRSTVQPLSSCLLVVFMAVPFVPVAAFAPPVMFPTTSSSILSPCSTVCMFQPRLQTMWVVMMVSMVVLLLLAIITEHRLANV